MTLSLGCLINIGEMTTSYSSLFESGLNGSKAIAAAFPKPEQLRQVGDGSADQHESRHRLPKKLGAKNGRPGT